MTNILPVPAATAERSFSLLQRLKTWLRNTMMQDRLTGLAVMNFHHEIPVDIDQVYATFIPSVTVEFCLLSTKV